MVGKLSDAVTRLAEYFGEDASRCQSNQMFANLRRFIDALRASKEKVFRQRRSAAQAEEKSKDCGDRGGSAGSAKESKEGAGQLLRDHSSRLRAAVGGNSTSEDESESGDEDEYMASFTSPSARK